MNLALLSDGLKAERDQGITIDVAYKYFSTSKRKFIVLDCPGHIQYTKNMITGCSSSQAAIIIIDARSGLKEQTKRHALITSMMQIKHLIVCVNKMDLIDYSEKKFYDIVYDFRNFSSKLEIPDIDFIPISALNGDNITSN